MPGFARSNIGFYIIGYFLVFAILMTGATAMSLFFPSTFWSKVWIIKKAEYSEMLQNAIWIGLAFLCLAIAMLFAAIGWFRKRKWGWAMTLGLFLLNGIGDAIQLVAGHVIEGAIGVIITGCIVFYLIKVYRNGFG